jgi:hypothetical protein
LNDIASKNPVQRNGGARLEQKSGTYFYFWRSSLTLKALSMTSNRNRAVAAAMGAAAALGLTVDDAIVLQESNKLAVRLLPCEVLGRVAEERIKRWAEFEVELALRLAETGSPVAALEPRVAPGVYGDSIRKVRCREVDLPHAVMQPLERVRVVA